MSNKLENQLQAAENQLQELNKATYANFQKTVEATLKQDLKPMAQSFIEKDGLTTSEITDPQITASGDKSANQAALNRLKETTEADNAQTYSSLIVNATNLAKPAFLAKAQKIYQEFQLQKDKVVKKMDGLQNRIDVNQDSRLRDLSAMEVEEEKIAALIKNGSLRLMSFSATKQKEIDQLLDSEAEYAATSYINEYKFNQTKSRLIQELSAKKTQIEQQIAEIKARPAKIEAELLKTEEERQKKAEEFRQKQQKDKEAKQKEEQLKKEVRDRNQKISQLINLKEFFLSFENRLKIPASSAAVNIGQENRLNLKIRAELQSRYRGYKKSPLQLQQRETFRDNDQTPVSAYIEKLKDLHSLNLLEAQKVPDGEQQSNIDSLIAYLQEQRSLIENLDAKREESKNLSKGNSITESPATHSLSTSSKIGERQTPSLQTSLTQELNHQTKSSSHKPINPREFHSSKQNLSPGGLNSNESTQTQSLNFFSSFVPLQNAISSTIEIAKESSSQILQAMGQAVKTGSIKASELIDSSSKLVESKIAETRDALNDAAKNAKNAVTDIVDDARIEIECASREIANKIDENFNKKRQIDAFLKQIAAKEDDEAKAAFSTSGRYREPEEFPGILRNRIIFAILVEKILTHIEPNHSVSRQNKTEEELQEIIFGDKNYVCDLEKIYPKISQLLDGAADDNLPEITNLEIIQNQYTENLQNLGLEDLQEIVSNFSHNYSQDSSSSHSQKSFSGSKSVSGQSSYSSTQTRSRQNSFSNLSISSKDIGSKSSRRSVSETVDEKLSAIRQSNSSSNASVASISDNVSDFASSSSKEVSENMIATEIEISSAPDQIGKGVLGLVNFFAAFQPDPSKKNQAGAQAFESKDSPASPFGFTTPSANDTTPSTSPQVRAAEKLGSHRPFPLNFPGL